MKETKEKEKNMDTITYSPPVDKLLTLGKPEPVGFEDWPNYLEFGLGPEHIPDLLRMLTDDDLFTDELMQDVEKAEGWAPYHALRALGQIKDVSAVEPLLSKAERLLGVDKGLGEWAIEELPDVFGLIGPAAIPALTAYIADESHDVRSRINVATGLEKIGTMHPEAREESIAALTRQLERAEENDSELNAFIISALLGLQATEAAPAIEQAFATDNVDMGIVGDWDDVQAELGLKPPKERPPSFFDTLLQPLPASTLDMAPQLSSSESETAPAPSFPTTSSKRLATQKTKRKMVKQSRKKNRRKK
jgi:hypothetical protein